MPGRIREANGGVVFLDEIADMHWRCKHACCAFSRSVSSQRRAAGWVVPVDFDLVSATQGDLVTLSSAGRFRRDLYYGVAGYTVSLPALRDRSDREALIAQLFAESGGATNEQRLDAVTLDRLTTYDWPGSVRELCSVLRSVAALAERENGKTWSRWRTCHLNCVAPRTSDRTLKRSRRTTRKLSRTSNTTPSSASSKSADRM